MANSGNFNRDQAKGPMASMSLSNAGQTMSKNINPTSHWESTYKNVVNTTTERD